MHSPSPSPAPLDRSIFPEFKATRGEQWMCGLSEMLTALDEETEDAGRPGLGDHQGENSFLGAGFFDQESGLRWPKRQSPRISPLAHARQRLQGD